MDIQKRDGAYAHFIGGVAYVKMFGMPHGLNNRRRLMRYEPVSNFLRKK